MSADLDTLIAAYLDGELDSDAARQVEEQLQEPELAETLSQELALRSYLGDLGPEMPPEDLIEELELTVTERPAAEPSEPGAVRFPTLQAALSGMSWMARGPALAVPVPVPVPDASALRAGEATHALGSASFKVASFAARRAFGKRKPRSRARRLGTLAWNLWRRK
jgi:anti-sigma factor RsiW